MGQEGGQAFTESIPGMSTGMRMMSKGGGAQGAQGAPSGGGLGGDAMGQSQQMIQQVLQALTQPQSQQITSAQSPALAQFLQPRWDMYS